MGGNGAIENPLRCRLVPFVIHKVSTVSCPLQTMPDRKSRFHAHTEVFLISIQFYGLSVLQFDICLLPCYELAIHADMDVIMELSACLSVCLSVCYGMCLQFIQRIAEDDV